ncbi:hypothetical protein DPMN_060579 [Dreissena polymorpha]|uniref:Uncharacterized protein n=1 Tax=Dreissena polymorpha TaxID=45954 RepID=A0A9D4HHP1_DREPO|nr:hypothetical protein DPMN_060579 [Dreissena polymorpha]
MVRIPPAVAVFHQLPLCTLAPPPAPSSQPLCDLPRARAPRRARPSMSCQCRHSSATLSPTCPRTLHRCIPRPCSVVL